MDANMINGRTLEEKIGQVLCFGFHESYAADGIKDLIQNHHLGNIGLFARNFKDGGQMKAMLAELQACAIQANGLPLLIGIDQEGGGVTRMSGDVTFFPGAMAVSATGNPENARVIGRAMGREMAALGINVDFAPVLDINTNPENPVIGVRSYGDTKERVTAYGMAMAEGLQESVIATGKHFPGHGDTHQDSHETLPVVGYDKQRLESEELYPFRMLINNGLKAIMTTHIVFPAYDPSGLPATLSAPVLTGLLRGGLGFDGLIITDCMEMKAISQFYGTVQAVKLALAAGADIILVCHTRETQLACMKELKKAVQDDPSLKRKLDEAVARVLRYKAWLSRQPQKAFTVAAHKDEARRISRESVTVFRGVCPKIAAEQAFNAVAFGSKRGLTGVENNTVAGDLERGLLERFKHANLISLPVDPGDADAPSAKLIPGLATYIFTYGAHMFPGQAAAVNRLLEAAPDAVVIAMRSPYDIRCFTQVRNYVMAYEYTPLSILSVLDMLEGAFEPTGKAPVDVLRGL